MFYHNEIIGKSEILLFLHPKDLSDLRTDNLENSGLLAYQSYSIFAKIWEMLNSVVRGVMFTGRIPVALISQCLDHFPGSVLTACQMQRGMRSGKEVPHVWCWKCSSEPEGLCPPRRWSSFPAFFLHDPGWGCIGMTRVQSLVGIRHIAQDQAKRRLVQGSQPKQEEASGGDALGRQGLESRRSDR